MLSARPPAASRLREARAAALAAIGPYRATTAPSVRYHSRGCVLVLGDAAAVHDVLTKLPPPLTVVAIASGTSRAAPLPQNVTWVPAHAVAVEGTLNCFAAQARSANGQMLDCSKFGPNADGRFDLVLDLNRPPLLGRGTQPAGYYAPADAAALSRALAQLRVSIGTFERARHVQYDADLCRHTPAQPCARCVPACPAGAITTSADSISVDAYHCEGCGMCDGVCQRGALRYASATFESGVVRLVRMIDAFVGASGIAPRVLLHAGDTAIVVADLPADVLPFELPVGHALRSDTWLAALTHGARQVFVFAPFGMARAAFRSLQRERALCEPIVGALGMDAACVTIVRDLAQLHYSQAADVPHAGAWRPASIKVGSDRRANLLACVDQLNAQHGSSCDSIALPAGSPLGAVQLDRSRCTLCRACVEACFSAALSIGEGDAPVLQFVESRCGQCGLCVERCSAQALSLVPRLVFHAVQRNQPQALAWRR